ncbi:MAG: gliding motility-associated C-terminal domain-containing protein [bacterium]
MHKKTIMNKITAASVAFVIIFFMNNARLHGDFQSLQKLTFTAGFIISEGVLFPLGHEDPIFPLVSVSGIPQEGVLVNEIILDISLSDNKSLLGAELVASNGNLAVEQSKSGAPSIAGKSKGAAANMTQTFTLGPLGEGIKEFSWQVKIPRVMVEEPGINFYLSVEDASNNIQYLGQSGGSVKQLEYISIMISRKITRSASASGGMVIFPDANPFDGENSLDLPVGALQSKTDLTLRILKNAESLIYGAGIGGLPPVMVYELGPNNTALQKQAKLTLLYYDTVEPFGIEDYTGFKETDLKICWWDGFEWRLVGGVIDTEKNLISTSINRFGIYGVFPLGALGPSVYRPKERIITPNSDGYNDFAQFDGLADRNININIFDVTGRKIRTIRGQPHEWDGRDDDGSRVENGVYIYQLKVDNELISGVIAVAK